MLLSTGIHAVDRLFGGGVPAGSLIVLTTPPQAQVDPLLNASLSERPTHYFTTIRDPDSIRETLDRGPTTPQIRTITNIGVGSALENLIDGIGALGSGENIIVSVMDPLETASSLEEYVTLLNYLVERLHETGSIGIVHCLDTYAPPQNRSFTLAAADFVWQLRCQRHKRKLSYTLEIPKASGLTLSDDDRVVALNLGRTVTVDTSRDI